MFMDLILSNVFIIGWMSATIRIATPLIYATIGELFNERAGVLNLGIEGIMLLGALVGFLVAKFTGSLWLGVLFAGISGSLINLIFAFLTVSLGTNQFISGLGITYFASGLSLLIYRLIFGSPVVPPTIVPFSVLNLPFLSHIPFLGDILFRQDPLVYIAFVILALSAFILNKTPWGLKIRTVGENPSAADTVGINVYRVRYFSLICGGFLVGIGGAYFSLAHFNMFLFGLVSGRGFICIALLIFGGWKPLGCLLGALFFGLIDALQFRLQNMGFNVPHQLFLLLPYLMPILALILVSKKRTGPAALLKPYRREE